MLKIILFTLSSAISVFCYAQPLVNNDSSKTATGLSLKAKPANTTTDLIVYPNPAKNKVTLQVKNFDPGMATVKVLDVKGKLVREDSRLLTNGTEEIIMFLMLKAGIYFIIITEPGKVVRKKLVMM
ncbi:MAG: T9SS type A sorting domain-containing protein [Aquabacterium sp.]|nr:T9SS type A sorting domain-containing protein [Ferruginibacter sp.]